jgi:hypothetical protein
VFSELHKLGCSGRAPLRERVNVAFSRAIQREFVAMTIHIFARPIVLDSALLGAAIFQEGVDALEQTAVAKSRRERCHCDRNDSYARLWQAVQRSFPDLRNINPAFPG